MTQSDYALTSTILWIGIIAGEPIVRWSLCIMMTCEAESAGEPIDPEVETGQDSRYLHVHLECGKACSVLVKVIR